MLVLGINWEMLCVVQMSTFFAGVIGAGWCERINA